MSHERLTDFNDLHRAAVLHVRRHDQQGVGFRFRFVAVDDGGEMLLHGDGGHFAVDVHNPHGGFRFPAQE